MAKRPCLDCGRLATSTRCPDCTTTKGREKRAQRPAYTNAERDRRAVTVALWRIQHGDHCPGWGVPPHLTADLTADHIVPVGAGGAESGELTVLCRSCNGRKQNRT